MNKWWRKACERNKQGEQVEDWSRSWFALRSNARLGWAALQLNLTWTFTFCICASDFGTKRGFLGRFAPFNVPLFVYLVPKKKKKETQKNKCMWRTLKRWRSIVANYECERNFNIQRRIKRRMHVSTKEISQLTINWFSFEKAHSQHLLVPSV